MATIVGSFSHPGRPGVDDEAPALLASLPRPPSATSSAWSSGVDKASLAGSSTLGASTVYAQGPVAVAADVRLDDADGLRRTLDARPRAPDVVLVALAYLRWGVDCVDHLDGDFALVVWDRRSGRVFAARDRFGVRPLAYATGSGRLWLGPSARPLLRAGISRRPDLWRIAETLAGTFADPEATAFEAVRRLPAGHRLTWAGGAVHVEAYWRPEVAGRELREPLDETAGRLRRALDTSVARHLAVHPALGAYLSGGLDSSSVVATARAERPEPFPVFTAVYPGLRLADEHAFATAVAERTGLRQIPVDPLGRSPVAEHEADALGIDEPLLIATWPMEKALLDAARAEGVRVLLSGHGGDHVLHASPLGVYGDWLRAGRWARLAREVRGAGSRAAAARAVWRLGFQDVVRERLPRSVRRARRPPAPAILHPALTHEIRFVDRLDALSPQLPSARHRAVALVGHAPTHRGLEQLAWLGEAMGLRVAAPYWDRDLVRVCLSVPRDHLLRDGVERTLLREAMAGRLPEAVRTRTSKATFDPLLNLTLRAHAMGDVTEMLDAPGPLAEWCDLDVLRTVAGRWKGAPEEEMRSRGSGDAQALLRAVTLWLWAQRQGI